MRKNILGRAAGHACLARDLRKSRSADETVRRNAQRHLADRMGRLRGLPQKIGQMLAMRDDPEYDAFANLCDHAEPLPFHDVETILTDQWGGPVSSRLREIDPIGRAASLGQVHQAQLHDGRTVAVKIAYPGIAKAVENDLRLLGWLSKPVGDLRRGFDLDAYRAEIRRDLEEELDYRTELANQLAFQQAASDLDDLVVPGVHPSICTRHVLVTDWEDGDNIDDCTQRWSDNEKDQLARTILRQFLTLLVDHGLVHADPNPGNYAFRRRNDGSPCIVLYDYGSIGRVSTTDRLALMRLIRDSVERDGDPLACLSLLGFRSDLLLPIRSCLPAVCRLLFEPFTQVAKYDLERWNRAARLDDILGDHRWNFRMAGPARLILLMRAFSGVEYYLRRLGRPVSWKLIFDKVLARHATAVSRLDLPVMEPDEPGFARLARHLRIEVTRDGRRSVSLTFPADTVDCIREVMDVEISERIEKSGTDIDEVVKNARRSAYAPGELFKIDQDDRNKSVRVWLE